MLKATARLLNDIEQYNTSFFFFQVPKEKRLLPVPKIIEMTEEQEKRSVDLGVSVFVQTERGRQKQFV